LGLNIEQKQAVVAEIGEAVAKAQAVVIAEYRSLRVDEMTQLRSRARSSGVYLRVLKNTLARRALGDTPFSGLTDRMVGPLAYGMSGDPVAVARVLHDFARENDKLVIKGGAMADKVLTPQDVARLATLPSREQLIAQLLGVMQAPVTKLARTLNEVPARFVRTLAAIRDQQEKQAA